MCGTRLSALAVFIQIWTSITKTLASTSVYSQRSIGDEFLMKLAQ